LVATPVDEVSLFIHSHYLKQYVPAGERVLEIGAGAGRFTQALAELGVRVLVADISEVQLELNRRHADEYGFAGAVESWQQMDICQMDIFPDGVFDCVVAYGGPLSYALDRRNAALSECRRVLRTGVVLLLSVMSLWGTVHRNLSGVLTTPPQANRQIVETGDISAATFPDRPGNYMHLFRAGELRNWLTAAGMEILALSAAGCLSTGWDASLEEIREEKSRWNELLRMELEASAESESLNMGTHLIAATRKS